MGGGGGGMLNFIHRNQPPSYIVNTANQNYIKTLCVRLAKPCSNPFPFISFYFLLFELYAQESNM